MPVPLPPLPRIGGGRLSGHTVVDVLADEHRRLTVLCRRLSDPAAPAPQRSRAAQVVTAALSRHLSAEEQYLYPAVRAVVPDGDRLADRELAEDRAILRAMRDLSTTTPDEPAFDRLAATVAGRLRRHTDAAAGEVLPLLMQVATVEELIRLGNRVQTAEEAAPTRPHPATPATPPWNKVVDPALGVVDRVRDAVAGRVTYAEDL